MKLRYVHTRLNMFCLGAPPLAGRLCTLCPKSWPALSDTSASTPSAPRVASRESCHGACHGVPEQRGERHPDLRG